MRLTILAAAALAFAAPLCAQAPRQHGHPDLTGFWNLARNQGTPDPAMIAKLPPNTVLLADTGIAEFPRDEYGGLKPKPDALAAAKKWNPLDDMTVSRACAMPSIVYATQGPFPIQIYQGTEFIILKYEYFDIVRIVFVDGRPHLPADAPHTKVGDSIGHWDGDELVVDTDHLEASTITNNGLNHSDKVHVVERFRLSADGNTLSATQWFEDPAVLDNNGARFIVWSKHPGQYVFPYECDPSFGENYRK